MNTLPQISYQVPDSLHVLTDIMPINGKMYPVLVAAPIENYLDLMAAIDGAPPKRLARWRNLFQPQTYVVYQPDVLSAQHVVFSFVVHPGTSYPKD